VTEKFRVIQLRENPIRKKRKVGRRRNKAPAPRRKRRPIANRLRPSSRRRRINAASRRRKPVSRGFLVEGLHQKGGRLSFVYWTGKSFSSKRRAAKIYRTEKEANKACHASMKRRAASYRLARVAAA
jgi:hypothetical protein